MVAPKRLAHIVLRVRNIAASEQFYTAVLGLRVTAKEFGMVFLSSSSEFSHELAIAPTLESGRVEQNALGLSHFAWQMQSFEDLQELHRYLKKSGAVISGIGQHGISIGIYLLDPDGNRVEVFYELPREEWPETNLFAGEFPLKLEDV